MTETNIHVQTENRVTWLTLQGRGDLNLITPGLFDSLETVLAELENDPETRVIVLRGHGERAFSGGVDVKVMRTFSPASAETFISGLHRVMRKIMTVRQPVIASIAGPCLGGAMELIMACDLRISADNALYGLPEVRVGVPSVIEASLLSRYIGLGRAKDLILTGDIIDAVRAEQMGLVSRLVPLADLERETRDMADRMLEMSPYVLGVQKDVLDKWLNLGQDQGALYSIKAFALCFSTSHPREAMTAFLEKRSPRFEPIES